MNKITSYVQQIGKRAQQSAAQISIATTAQKNLALSAMAESINQQRADILAANGRDMENGKKANLDAALLDRLMLDEKRIDAMIEGLKQIIKLPDPVGAIDNMRYMPSGIQLGKMRTPLGVIGIIYESRPNVTVDAAALCTKSGNASILRGGKESIHSNLAIGKCIQEGLSKAGLNPDTVQLIENTDREVVGSLLQSDNVLDVLIPRGGKSLVARVTKEATMPVIKHLDGICHLYIDTDADLEMAHKVAINSKTHRYGVCNALETLLVAKDIAPQLLPKLVDQYKKQQVELFGCSETIKIVNDINAATEQDWSTEYLAAKLAIKIVNDVEQAIAHIAQYSSQHTESIITNNLTTAQLFLRAVDSSSVMVNASTRFADGFEYGLGAEIGISTNKLHARGPVGLEGLTCEKFVVIGSGQIRQ